MKLYRLRGRTKMVNLTKALFILFIYVRFSLWFLSVSEWMIDVIVIVMFLIFQIFRDGRIFINKKYLMIATLMCSLVMCSSIINCSHGSLDISVVLQIIITLIIVSTLTKMEFCECYTGAMYIIAFLSLVGFIIGLFLPSFVAKFPYITAEKWIGNGVAQNIRNLFICVFPLGANYKRNWGIFYEPGMFAFFLNVSIYIMIFVTQKINVRRLAILSIALATTTSTNGYITLAIIYLSYFLQNENSVRNSNLEMFSKKNKSKKQKRIFLIFSMVGVFVLIRFFLNNPERLRFLVGKLGELNGLKTEGSGYERINAVRLAMNAFMLNPFWGLSVSGISSFAQGSIMTFTPMQWFATYGILYGVVCNLGLVLFAVNSSRRMLPNVLQIAILYSMIVTQNLTSNIIILIIIFYSLGDRIKVKGKLE